METTTEKETKLKILITENLIWILFLILIILFPEKDFSSLLGRFKVFSKILRNSQGKTCAAVSFLIKLNSFCYKIAFKSINIYFFPKFCGTKRIRFLFFTIYWRSTYNIERNWMNALKKKGQFYFQSYSQVDRSNILDLFEAIKG